MYQLAYPCLRTQEKGHDKTFKDVTNIEKSQIKDDYTKKTKIWLNERCKKCDENGIYHDHQAICGFRQGHNDSAIVFRYTIIFQVMKAFSHLKIDSLLDVGGAEG